jgi:hydrogenase nickel incorporation protein HypA/HybF
MHELALTQEIATLVGRVARGRRVTRVTVEIGAASGVLADAVSFCWDALAPGTPLEGTALHIVEVAGQDLLVKSMDVEEEETT